MRSPRAQTLWRQRQRAYTTDIAIVAGTLFFHFWKLGQRPLAHDESIDAWFSLQAGHGAIIRYDPVYHGPLRFFLQGGILRVFGSSAGQTRYLSALCGSLMVVAVLGSRKMLGKTGSRVGAVLLTVSPTVLTVTRTGREDSLVALLSLGMLLAVGRLLTEPKPRHLVTFLALLALSFATKETTFIFCAAGGAFLVFAASWHALSAVRNRREHTTRDQTSRPIARILNIGSEVWLSAGTVFILLFVAVFTSFFRWNQGIKAGIFDGIKYWISQHKVGRGGQPWFFYLSIYTSYEWLLLGLGVSGLVLAIKKRAILGNWFAVMGLVQLAIYSWAGEKFAWLAIHPLIPMALLAALFVQMASEEHKTSNRLLEVGFCLAAMGTLFLAIGPAIDRGADPRELLVTVQTSESVKQEANWLVAASKINGKLSVVVDESDAGSWPWVWYLRNIRNVRYEKLDPRRLPEADVVILRASAIEPIVPVGFEIRRFPLRVWWIPDYRTMTLGDAARWFLTRTTWNSTGSSDQYLITRAGMFVRPKLTPRSH